MAASLKKGTLVEVSGRIYVSAFVSKEGEAKASLNCHVNSIKIHAGPKEVEVIGKPVAIANSNGKGDEDTPF